MQVGDTARRSRAVSARDIELFTELTGDRCDHRRGRGVELREDKPISTLRTTITNQDGVVVLEGTALVYREPL